MEDGDAGRWILSADERIVIMTKNRTQRLIFAVLLLFYKARGRFPEDLAQIDLEFVERAAEQIAVPARFGEQINMANRTAERYRAQLRAFYGSRETSVADAEMLTAWLSARATAVGTLPDHLISALESHCREQLIELPSADRVDRILRDAVNDHEYRFYSATASRLIPSTRERLEALLRADDSKCNAPENAEPSELAPALGFR